MDEAPRSPLVETALLAIGIAYVNVGIFILVFSEPPTIQHLLWAAALGIGCGLLTCRRVPKAAEQAEPTKHP
jgi:hypothetical protein